MAEVFFFRSKYLLDLSAYETLPSDNLLRKGKVLYSPDLNVIAKIKEEFPLSKPVFLEERTNSLICHHAPVVSLSVLQSHFKIFNTDPKFYRIAIKGERGYNNSYQQYPTYQLGPPRHHKAKPDMMVKINFSNPQDAAHARFFSSIFSFIDEDGAEKFISFS